MEHKQVFADHEKHNKLRLESTPTPPASSLLNLPAELRDLIYKYALGHHTTYIRPSRMILVSTSPLASVSRQVRNECLSVAWLSNKFEVKVKNMRFRPLITFIESLSDLQLRWITGAHMVVHLELNGRVLGASLERSLNAWASLRKSGVAQSFDVLYKTCGLVDNLSAYSWNINMMSYPYRRDRDAAGLARLVEQHAIMRAVDVARSNEQEYIHERDCGFCVEL